MSFGKYTHIYVIYIDPCCYMSSYFSFFPLLWLSKSLLYKSMCVYINI